MIGQRRKFLRGRCSKTASTLILSLLLRLKILHLTPHKFTFLLFRSNFSCLFLHFNDVAPAIIPNCINICTWLLLRLEQHRPNTFSALLCWEKQHQDKLEQGGSMQCIVFFSLVKLDINLKKITHSKKFSSKWIGSRRKI